MNFNLNIHRVTDIRLSPVREHTAPGGQVYGSRTLIIQTTEGNFELDLFSQYVSEDEEVELLEVKA